MYKSLTLTVTVEVKIAALPARWIVRPEEQEVIVAGGIKTARKGGARRRGRGGGFAGRAGRGRTGRVGNVVAHGDAGGRGGGNVGGIGHRPPIRWHRRSSRDRAIIWVATV